MHLFWRALLAFLALPVVVAGLVPWLFLRPGAPRVMPNGLPFMALGLALLLWCVKEFYVSGKGTLAPWDPPRHLVTTGPYRHTRNPMYVAVLLILAGWALTLDFLDVRAPLYYAALVALAFHLRVVFFEEQWAARTFGARWDAYRQAVPRWLFRHRPFLTLALLVGILMLLALEPIGFDYDPHPVRQPLRTVAFVLGAPGLLSAFLVTEALPPGAPTRVLGAAAGLAPYLLADWVYRAWRARDRSRIAHGVTAD